MKSKTPSDRYITTEILPRIPDMMDRNRAKLAADSQRERCLTPNGHYLFFNAILCYLARRRDEGDELVAKATEFLQLAHATREEERHGYAHGLSEGMRSAELSYLHWLYSGDVDAELLEDSRANLDIYCSRTHDLDRKSATIMTPMLLYTKSYALIRSLAERFAIDAGEGSRRKATGLFGHAVRLAVAEDEARSAVEKQVLRKSIGKQLFAWIDKGHFGNIAYSLHSLFPRPEGPPCRLIEDCWNYIPENTIKNWLSSK